MKLLEYEGKKLLLRHGLPVPAGTAITKTSPVNDIQLPAVVKVQIPVGGRGKAGGIQKVNTLEELEVACKDLFSREIRGHRASTLLIEELLDVRDELYLSITIDRSLQQIVVLAHAQGGVEIENAADADSLLRLPLTDKPDAGVAGKVSAKLGLPNTQMNQLQTILQNLYDAFVVEDALLIEINPLVLTQGELVCADAKIELDDTAAFRHQGEWDFETKAVSGQFVVLSNDGNVASMANGAGLAMATMDAIKAAGAEPANFLDIGGGTNAAGMVRAFEQISNMPRVQSIVINVFAGITRCDEVAQAILAAREQLPNLPPLFIRLAGTNEHEGRRLLDEAGVAVLPSLEVCVTEAVKVVKHV